MFKWLEIHKKAFQEFRNKLEKCAINHHFEENRLTFLFTDAGKNVHDSNNKIAEFALILSQKDLESEKL